MSNSMTWFHCHFTSHFSKPDFTDWLLSFPPHPLDSLFLVLQIQLMAALFQFTHLLSRPHPQQQAHILSCLNWDQYVIPPVQWHPSPILFDVYKFYNLWTQIQPRPPSSSPPFVSYSYKNINQDDPKRPLKKGTKHHLSYKDIFSQRTNFWAF